MRRFGLGCAVVGGRTLGRKPSGWAVKLVREDLVDVTPRDHTECGNGESWPQTNSLLMWAKSIAPHAEEGAVEAAALVPGVNHVLRAAERGHGRIWCRFPFEKKGKQIQRNIVRTEEFRACLWIIEVSEYRPVFGRTYK